MKAYVASDFICGKCERIMRGEMKNLPSVSLWCTNPNCEAYGTEWIATVGHQVLRPKPKLVGVK